jgi:hypothetical protein
MKKLGLVFAVVMALAVTTIFLASAQAQAPAQGKRLWQGFVEELQKIGAPPPAPAKAAPAKPAPAKKAAPKKAEPVKAAPAKAAPAKAAPAKAPPEKK